MFQRPPGVTSKHNRFYLVRKNKWLPLTREDEGEIALLEAFYELTRDDPRSMAALLLAYLKDGTGEIREVTRLKYRQAIVSRLIPWCGHMAIGTVRPGHVAQFLEGRKRAKAATAGNRERAVLSSAFAYGMRRGWVDFNPCYGVRRNRERPSRRYVEHQKLVTELDRAPPELYHLLAAAYLTGARQTDLRELTRKNVTAEGLEYTESKTDKLVRIPWTPTLRKIIRGALERSECSHVFVTGTGIPWSQWGLQSALRRFKPGFRFRDLRPKAETDAPGTIGHTGQMQRAYTRRVTLKAVR